MMSSEIASWWLLLCLLAAVNIIGWLFAATILQRREGLLPADVRTMRRLQLLLSAGYVLGCAFRSAFPVFDVPRFCLVDTWLSSVIVGRSVATFAELCFVAQWALMMREISNATGSRVGRITSIVVVPLIVIAETFSWYSVLTTSNLGHVLEESIWGLAAVLLVMSLVAIWPRCDAALRSVLAASCAIGVGYIGFMFMVDVPMYWSRWIADEASGRAYMSIAQGFADVSQRWVVSHRWEDWQHEVTWMTLYFSVAVWLSIALIHAPVLERRVAAGDRQRTLGMAMRSGARALG
ncbi:MAG: hypothetical protein ACKVQT_15805 [Burkholderiales bacterium]